MNVLLSNQQYLNQQSFKCYNFDEIKTRINDTIVEFVTFKNGGTTGKLFSKECEFSYKN